MVSNGGVVEAFGDAELAVDMSALNQSVIGVTPTPDGRVNWLDAADGGIFTFGDAGFEGSTGSLHLNQPVVGMAPHHDGRGYWMVVRRRDLRLRRCDLQGIDGFAASQPTRRRHGSHPRRSWLLDGGVRRWDLRLRRCDLQGIARGQPAKFPDHLYGAHPRQQRVLAVEPKNGTVYAFGDAVNRGSVGAGSAPATSMTSRPSGGGYWVLTADGAVHAFGDTKSYGSPATSAVAVAAPAAVATTTVPPTTAPP